MPAASILFIYLFFVFSCAEEFRKTKGSPANTITKRADFTDGSQGLG